MSDRVMSRRVFLTSAGTVIGAAAAGVGLTRLAAPAAAAPAGVPWPYPTTIEAQPVPERLARRAYELYWQSGCCEASWWPFVEALSAEHPDTWGTLPRNLFRFGGGGVAGWGTICGVLNAAAALVGVTVGTSAHRANLTDAVMQYYANTALPTKSAWKSYRGSLGLGDPWDPAVKPLRNVPTSTSHSPLCLPSLAQWTMTSGANDDTPRQRDRCAKACFDVTRKVAELLNTYFQISSAPPVALDPSVEACRTCHLTYTGDKMACSSCHDHTVGHAE